MTASRDTHDAAVGFTVKSGWASAVLLVGSAEDPQVVDSRRVELSDPRVPASRQPYHDGFATARRDGPALQRLLRSVARFGNRSVAEVFRQYAAAGHKLQGVAIVVGSLVDPASLANDHMRIHALEGRLFRSVVKDAAAQSGLAWWIWRERDLLGVGARTLRRSEEVLRRKVTALGKAATGPWRAEQKMAAIAAWLALSKRGRATAEVLEFNDSSQS